MKVIGTVFLVGLGFFGSAAYASSHLNEDELHLEAVKAELVEAARSSSSTVVSTGWLDSEGALHESTVIKSGARIRGIRVKSYIDAISQGVDVSLDSQEALLPECLAKESGPRRLVGLNVEGFPMDGRNGSAFLGPLVKLLRDFVHEAFSKNSASLARAGSLSSPGPRTLFA